MLHYYRVAPKADHFADLYWERPAFQPTSVLREHGTPATSQHDIFQAIVVSRIQYAARHQRGRSGMCLAADRARLDVILRRSKRLGYCSRDLPSIADLFKSADEDFFHRINTNPSHVLQPYLPDRINLPYI